MNASETAVASLANVLVGEVFLIIGQSNADGSGTNLQSYSGALGAKEYRQSTWAALGDPVGQNSTGGSPWPLLAGYLETALGVPVAIVSGDTAGATSLVSAGADWTDGGAQYENTVTYANACGTNAFRALLWYQGEADAKAGVSTAAYKAALSEMLNDFQRDIPAAANSKLIAAMIGPSDTATQTQLDDIRLAIRQAWDDDADILPGPTAHANFNPADQLHWKTDSELQRLGKMWARTILGNLFGGESPRGPVVVSSAVGTGSPLGMHQLTITFDRAVTGASSTGWSVTDDGGAVTISSVSATGSVVTITCARDLAGPVSVSFARGETAMDSTFGDAGTLVSMPVEPIYSLAAGTGAGEIPSSLLSGLLAWWTMNETTGNRTDAHNDFDLVAENAVSYEAGKKGNAVKLQGASPLPNISVADNAAFNFSTGFSLSTWIKQTDTRTILDKTSEFLIHWSTNTLLFRGYNTGGSGADGRKVTNASDLKDGTWRHLVVTCPANGPANGKIWIDGVRRDDSSNYVAPGWTAWNNTAAAIKISPSQFSNDTARSLDETAIWNRDLSDAEVATLYNGGAGIAYSEL